MVVRAGGGGGDVVCILWLGSMEFLVTAPFSLLSFPQKNKMAIVRETVNFKNCPK